MRTTSMIAACIMAVFFCGTMAAQNEQPGKPEKQRPSEEEMMAKKTEQMQRKLLLDEKEAAQFAPLYQEYLRAMKECFPAPPAKPEKKQALTDDDLDKMIQARFAAQKKLAETQEIYYGKFKKILNVRQLEQIFRGESCCQKPEKFGRPNGKHQRRHMPAPPKGMPEQPGNDK